MKALELIEAMRMKDRKPVDDKTIAIARAHLTKLVAYVMEDIRNCGRCGGSGVMRIACSANAGQIVETPIPCETCSRARDLMNVSPYPP